MEHNLIISFEEESPVDSLLIEHLPHVVQMFRNKARDYGSDNHFTADALGARGQFAEIWRKVGKLKRCMWDGKSMKYEQSDEILSDLFGHIMLAMDYVKTDAVAKKYEEFGAFNVPR